MSRILRRVFHHPVLVLIGTVISSISVLKTEKKQTEIIFARGLLAPYDSVETTVVDQNQYNHSDESRILDTVSSPLSSESPSISPLPYLIIHMGPDKTGTTTIQSFLENKISRASLEGDGFDVSFSKGSGESKNIWASRFFLRCFTNDARRCHRKERKTWNNRLLQLQSTANSTGRNILWSNEGFRWMNLKDNSDWAHFLQHMKKYFQVRVVLVYRRYFDWLPSRYNEEHKSGELVSLWPGQGSGIEVPTFSEYFENEVNGTCFVSDCEFFFTNRRTSRSTNSPMSHPMLEMHRQLLAQNVSVKVLNFHGETNLLEAFTCDAIPRANETCEMVKSSAGIKQQANRQSEIETIAYDRIAVRAYNMGLIQSDSNRRHIRDRLPTYLKEATNSTNLPWICPTDKVLERLGELSYEFETQELSLLEGSGSKDKLFFHTSHQAAFEASKSQLKYCHVNATNALLNEHLVSLLRTFQSPAPRRRRRVARKPSS